MHCVTIRQHLQFFRRRSTKVDAEEIIREPQEIKVNNLLTVLLVLALIMGLFLGLMLHIRSEPYTETELSYLRLPGEILLNMLNLLTLPLVVSSIISGLTSVLDTKLLSRLGLQVGVFYLVTTLLASLLGMVMASTAIHLANCLPENPSLEYQSGFHQSSVFDQLLNLMRQMMPDNVMEATFRKILKIVKEKRVKNRTSQLKITNVTLHKTVMIPEIYIQDGINLVGVITMSIIFGIIINRLKIKALALKILFESAYDVTAVVVQLVVWYLPFGVAFLVMKDVAAIKDYKAVFRQTSYLVVVLLSLGIHAFVVLPVLYFAICRQNPFGVMRGIAQALLTAFATSSSIAALPVTMSNLETNNRLDPRVIQLVAPIGAATSLNGKALFSPVAVVFIGCMANSDYVQTTQAVILIGLTAISAAVATAGLPEGDLVAPSFVLSAVGLPTERIGYILPLHWLLCRFWTVVNVLGDAYCASIVHHISSQHLQLYDELNPEEITGPSEHSDSNDLLKKTTPVLSDVSSDSYCSTTVYKSKEEDSVPSAQTMQTVLTGSYKQKP